MSGIFALYRVKNEERFIEKSLLSIKDLVDSIVLFDDHSTDKTVEIAQSFEKVKVISSPFEETVDEVRDKTLIVQEVLKKRPEWCVCLDGDEELIAGGALKLRKFLEKLMEKEAVLYNIYLQFLYIWNRHSDVRQDGIYKMFCQPRIWNLLGDEADLSFNSTYGKSGFHCGWVPSQLKNGKPLRTKIPIVHWGNHNEQIRRKKYVWYNLNDRNDWFEDRYRHIMGAGEDFMHSGGKIELVSLESFF